MRKSLSGRDKALVGLAITIVLCLLLAAPALGFNYSLYEESTLKEIAAMMAEDAKEHEIKDYTGVKEKLSFYFLDPYRLRVCPASGPVEISKQTAEKLDFYIMNLRGNKFTSEFRKLYNHELVIEESGNTFIFAFQDGLVPYFRGEVKPGDCADLYARLLIYDFVTKRTILIVTEFNSQPRESKGKEAS